MSRRVKNVPQIMQMEALECGAACLAMIMAYYGRWITLEQARAECGVSRDGSKAVNILRAARRYGFTARGKSYSLQAMRTHGKLPLVAFVNFSHFVVVSGFGRNCVYVNDPARGSVKVSNQEFEDAFTGIALEFEPGENFQKGGKAPSTLAFVRKRLQGLGPAIAFVMVAAAVVSLAGIMGTSLAKVFIDNILSGGNQSWVWALASLMLAIAIVGSVATILNALNLTRIQGKIAVVSSSRFMRHLLHLPMGFYAQRMVGDLQQRQSSNETIAFTMIAQIAPVFVDAAMLVLYLVVMVRLNTMLALVGVATVLLNAFVARYISRKRVNVARAMAMDSGKLYACTVSGANMIETIKAAGAENGYFQRWAGYQASVNEGRVRLASINEYLGSIPLMLTELANIAVLVLGVLIIVRGDFTIGMLLAFQGFLQAFMTPVTQLIGLGQTVQEMQTQMERVEDVLRYPVDVPEEAVEPITLDPLDDEKLTGEVELDNVTFGYSPLEEPLIKDFSLHLEPGQWVALVGPSGCGKSTIAKLVSGLYVPWSGEVRFDGECIEQISRPMLRGSLAVVDQDIVTFDDTVFDNVKLWDHSIEDYEVIVACRDAEIHDVIIGREGGYNSRILPGGSNFSGGQLQRLEIARVLAEDPTVIVLDEATSALDAQTEAEVIHHIREREITCIVVAHRLSTIRDCDEIIVLDEGKVVERGTHDKLMAANGAYADLVRSD